MRLGDGVGGEVGLHPRHAGPHVAHRVGHELGRHRGHLVVVAAHGVGEGVAAAHPHPHPHAPPPVMAQAEEVRHPGPLLLGLGGELPVPGLDTVLLHGQWTFNLEEKVEDVVLGGDWCYQSEIYISNHFDQELNRFLRAARRGSNEARWRKYFSGDRCEHCGNIL